MSEFIKVFEGADYIKAMEVLNEHMECVKVLYPKEYKKIISVLKGLA